MTLKKLNILTYRSNNSINDLIHFMRDGKYLTNKLNVPE